MSGRPVGLGESTEPESMKPALRTETESAVKEPESSGESETESSAAMGWPEEENKPRQLMQREGKTELGDLVDDVFLHLFQRLVKTDLKSLSVLESTCRRLHRLAKHKAVYKGCTHVKVDKSHGKKRDDGVKDKFTGWWRSSEFVYNNQRVSLAPGFELVEGDWIRVLGHLRERGARLSVLELEGTWWDLPEVSEGLRTLVADEGFLQHARAAGFPEVLGRGETMDLRSLECLVVSFLSFDFDEDSDWEGENEELMNLGTGFLRPGSLPALRVLIVRCGSDVVYRELSEELCQVWKNTELRCLKTPFPEFSFLKGPRNQPPHPDLPRLSQRYDWAH